MKRFKGFTLTEVMIALAVIGIIVAIVTPAIVKTRPNKNRMMIKKTYYTVENIVSSLINDERLYPDKTDDCYQSPTIGSDCRWGFDDTSKVNYEGVEYEGGTKFAKLFKSKLNVKKDSNGGELAFYTTDGVYWNLNSTDSGTGSGWKTGKAVGTFDNADNDDPSAAMSNRNASGIGYIYVQVGTDGVYCTADSVDCDTYTIQILANGKMRIDPTHTEAIKAVEVNTSLRN